MKRRRTERPVERLRSSWTSTADLEETIAAMFHVSPEPPGTQPAIAPVPLPELSETKLDIESPTGGEIQTPSLCASLLDPVGISTTPTGSTSLTHTEGRFEMPIGCVSKVLPLEPESLHSESHPVGIGETAPLGSNESPILNASETHPVGVIEIRIKDADGPATEGASETDPVGGSQTATVGVTKSPNAIEAAPPEILDTRRLRLRPVRTISDGLTPGELLLLTEMFQLAASQAGSKDRILYGAGYRTLSERTGQDPKTVKRNRIGLVKKFCIEPIGPNTFTEAAPFRIFHFDHILARWRGRGLVWVRRSGRSVDLMAVGFPDTPTVCETMAGPANTLAGETPTGGRGVS